MTRFGFTLLEVLISLVIFAVSAVALGSAYVNVLNSYDVVGRSNVGDEDLRFARLQLLVEPDRKKAEEGGEFDSADIGHLHWRAAIEPTETADLFRVTFTCEISQSGSRPSRPPSVTTFMLLRPTWSEGADATKLRQNAKDRIQELRNKKPL